MNIYIDMDGVVADFKRYAQEFFNQQLDDRERLPPTEWNRLSSNQRLYRDLKVKPGAYELINWVQKYATEHNCGLFFLTAIPRNNDMPYAVMDKVEWCQKYFPGIPCFIGPFSHDKAKRCEPGDILIDDRLSNIEDWRNANGLAWHYKEWQECYDWLRATLNTNYT